MEQGQEGAVVQAAPKPWVGKAKISAIEAAASMDGVVLKRCAFDWTGGSRLELIFQIIETRIFCGLNYWVCELVIRMVVDLGVFEDFLLDKILGFMDALVGLLPSFEDHACSLGRRGGFITWLRDGTWMGHILEHIVLELQNLAGTDVRHGKTRSIGEYGCYNVIYEYREENVGIEAGKIAVALVNILVGSNDLSVAIDFMAQLERLILLAERQVFGFSTQAIFDEAASRDIFYIRLDRYSLVQLGQGVH